WADDGGRHRQPVDAVAGRHRGLVRRRPGERRGDARRTSRRRARLSPHRHPRGGTRMTTTLPIATPAEVRAEGAGLFRRHRRQLAVALGVHVLAATAGLAGPFLLGRIVDAVTRGSSTTRIDVLAASLAGFIIVRALLTRVAINRSLVLGER